MAKKRERERELKKALDIVYRFLVQSQFLLDLCHSKCPQSIPSLLLKFSTYSPYYASPRALVTYVIRLLLHSLLLLADSDAETDEDEGHIEDAEKAQQREREKHDESGEEQSNKDIQDTDEDVAVSLLRAKNLSLLQSQ